MRTIKAKHDFTLDLEDGRTVEYDRGKWPEDRDGNPRLKKDVLYNDETGELEI